MIFRRLAAARTTYSSFTPDDFFRTVLLSVAVLLSSVVGVALSFMLLKAPLVARPLRPCVERHQQFTGVLSRGRAHHNLQVVHRRAEHRVSLFHQQANLQDDDPPRGGSLSLNRRAANLCKALLGSSARRLSQAITRTAAASIGQTSNMEEGSAALPTNSKQQGPTTSRQQHRDGPLVIVIAGPTGVGKSAVAASLCHPARASRLLRRADRGWHDDDDKVRNSGGAEFRGTAERGRVVGGDDEHGRRGRGHIVSADSVQAYRGVHVGANKPSREEMETTPHHLVDVVDTDGHYSAAEWMDDCISVLERLTASKKNGDAVTGAKKDDYADENRAMILPVVVGGTMMYVEWLIRGKPDAPRPSPDAARNAEATMVEFQRMGEEEGWEAAVQHVATYGDIFKSRIDKLHGKDWYRLRRTLEVALSTRGQSEEHVLDVFNGQRMGGLETLGYDVRCFFLCPDDRMRHCEAVDMRCEEMLLNGLLGETADLRLAGRLPDGGQPARAIGYRQALEYLCREGPQPGDVGALADFLHDFKSATRQYAKKQTQWYRRDDGFIFVPVALDQPTSGRVEAAADIVMNMCHMSRGDYEAELLAAARADSGGGTTDDGECVSISARTKRTNEAQARGMKFFISKRHVLVDGSPELESVLSEADECTARMQGLSSLVQSS